MVPVAPPRLSTTTGWPIDSGMYCDRMRARMSVAPPGGNPTTSRIGRSGYLPCACACGAAMPMPASITAMTTPFLMIPPLISACRLSCIRDSFDFDQHFRGAQRPHFDQRGSRKVAAEELAPRAPDLGVLLDIDHVDGHLDDVVEAGARTFADQLDARENVPGLFVLVS